MTRSILFSCRGERTPSSHHAAVCPLKSRLNSKWTSCLSGSSGGTERLPQSVFSAVPQNQSEWAGFLFLIKKPVSQQHSSDWLHQQINRLPRFKVSDGKTKSRLSHTAKEGARPSRWDGHTTSEGRWSLIWAGKKLRWSVRSISHHDPTSVGRPWAPCL